MALIHDIGESEIGDIFTRRGTKALSNLKDKQKAKRRAFAEILSLVDDKECTELFDEYEEDRTKEARLVKRVDKLEMAIQAHEYEQEHKIELREFFEDSEYKITDKELRKIYRQFMELRRK